MKNDLDDDCSGRLLIGIIAIIVFWFCVGYTGCGAMNAEMEQAWMHECAFPYEERFDDRITDRYCKSTQRLRPIDFEKHGGIR